MKISKAVLYTYFFAVCFTVGYYFLRKYSMQVLMEKYPDKPIGIFQTFLYFPFAIIYMWIPGIVALIFAKKENFSLPVFNKLNRYHLYAIFLPVVIIILIIFVSMTFAKVEFSYLMLMLPPTFHVFDINILNYIMYFLFLLLILLFFGLAINTFISLGEELMWRGYLLEKLKKINFWKASLIIGTLWGIWHFPIIILFGHNYPNVRFIGLVWMVILTILTTPLYIYLRNKGKSILVPAIFHGIFNVLAPYSLVLFYEPNHLLIGATGVAAFIVWMIVNFFLYLMMLKKS